MSLRTKSLLILACSLLLALAVLVGSLSSILSRQFLDLEVHKVEENVRRVQLALDNLVKQLSSKTTDWAQWDDTYAFMQDRNQEYLHSNISFETLSAIDVSHVVYRDADGVLVRGYEVDYANASVGDLGPEAMKTLAVGDIALAGKTPEAVKSGLLLIGERPFIFAAIPIFDSRRAEQCRGSLLFSIALDQKLTAALAEQTRLSLQLLDPARLPAALEPMKLKASTPHAVAVSAEETRGYQMLTDSAGRGIRLVEISLARDIYQQGKQAVQLLVAALLAVMVLTLIVSAFSLNYWVLAPLRRLKEAVGSIDISSLNGARVHTSGRDEIAALGTTINSFLRALEENQSLLVRARNLAEDANRAKSKFIARVSHELRTPVSGIIGINNIVMDRKDISKAVQQLLQMGSLAAESLLSVVNEILDFSKAEAGELSFSRVSFDFRQVLRETMQIVEARLEGTGGGSAVELLCELDPAVPQMLIGDPLRLRQVLINLLGNAVKFTERGSIGVRVGLQFLNASECRIGIEVWDTGIGIPEEKLDTVFRPFKQLDEATAKYQGTGLGLSIVKQFTEGMGGTVAVRSQLHQGTTFSVSLLFGVEAVVGPPHLKALPRQILIVGEHTMLTRSLREAFARRGLAVLQSDAVQRRDQAAFAEALLRSDLVVATESAFDRAETASLIRELAASCSSCVVALVRASKVELREQLFQERMRYVLTPAISAEDLLLAYQDALPQQDHPLESRKEALKFTRKLHVLIADDTAPNRFILESMLEDAGHQVTSVTDGKEIVALLTPMLHGLEGARHFDVVLTDVTMTIMNGDEAAARIREIERTHPGCPHVPIVAVTAHALPGEHEDIWRAGVDGVLIKPLTPEAVAAELERVFPVPVVRESGAHRARADTAIAQVDVDINALFLELSQKALGVVSESACVELFDAQAFFRGCEYSVPQAQSALRRFTDESERLVATLVAASESQNAATLSVAARTASEAYRGIAAHALAARAGMIETFARRHEMPVAESLVKHLIVAHGQLISVLKAFGFSLSSLPPIERPSAP